MPADPNGRSVVQTPTGPVNVPATINPCYYDNPKSPSNPIIVPYFNKGGFNNSNTTIQDRIAYTANYQLPFGKSATGVEAVFIKGWATNVAGSWSTGLPFTVGQSVNTTGIGSSGNPDQVCSGKDLKSDASEMVRCKLLRPPVRDQYVWKRTRRAVVRTAPAESGFLAFQGVSRSRNNSGCNSGPKCSTCSTIPTSTIRPRRSLNSLAAQAPELPERPDRT